MADLTFAMHTNAILQALPYWFQMRKQSKESIGARFLNITGLELDDLLYVIEYAYRQCYIDTCDLNQVDFCYRAVIPMPYKASDIKLVMVNGAGLTRKHTLKEFFGVDQNGVKNNPLYSYETYFIDEERNILYTRKQYGVDAVFEHGKVSVLFKNNTEKVFKLEPNPVWNFFDELGALLSTKRIFMEPNVEYKERILDVFKNVANASKDGLINGIGRELALRRNVKWMDVTKEIELLDSMIVLNSIKVNDHYVEEKDIFLTAEGTVIIKPFIKKPKKDMIYVVSYVHGLEMHQLYNVKEDVKLFNELFTVEMRATNRLRRYIEILNSDAPIFWDDFRWNEHYWDQNEKDVSGVGYIPNLYDAGISGFLNYV